MSKCKPLMAIVFLILILQCSEAPDHDAIPDVTAPPPPDGFTATAGNAVVDLEWTNPDAADFEGVRIRYAFGIFPTKQDEGFGVNGLGGDIPGVPSADGSFSHEGLDNGRTYYYSIFSYDAARNYSDSALALAVPTGPDTIPPAPIISFIATPGDSLIQLQWTMPSDPDAEGVRIRYSSDGFPASITEGFGVVGEHGEIEGKPDSTHTYVHERLRSGERLKNGIRYYYSVFTFDEVPNYSGSDTASAIPQDVTSPTAVTYFEANALENSVELEWTNPEELDFKGVMIRYSTVSYPASAGDGDPVNGQNGVFLGAPGSDSSVTHESLENDATYYYSIFAFDEVPNYSEGVTAAATPQDVTAPGPITGLTAEAGPDTVRLSWSNPDDSDFAGVLIRYSEATFPTRPGEGSPVENGSGGAVPAPDSTCTHRGLEVGQLYYYSVFAFDEVPNYSEAAHVAATPNETAASLTEAGWTKFEDGEISGARDDFFGALVLDKSYGDAHNGLGWCWLRQYFLNPAIESFDSALVYAQTLPNPADPYAGRAIAYRDIGDTVGFRDAISSISGALDIDPAYVFVHHTAVDSLDLHLIKAQCYFGLSEYDSALYQVNLLNLYVGRPGFACVDEPWPCVKELLAEIDSIGLDPMIRQP